jgi:hypothetical protein
MKRGAWFGTDFFVAVVVTLFGAGLSWFLVGGVPPIGIDDAAITRSYAENLANGAGYVYNVGGERVEGSTALLWVGMLTVLYAVTPTPEWLILGLCTLLTVGAVLAVLRIARLIATRLTDGAEGVGGVAVAVLAVLLAASPGYFLWSVWTMMELALWSATVLWLVLHLMIWSEGEVGRRAPSLPEGSEMGLLLPAAALPLIRPEGIAVAAGLIVLGTLLAPRFWRRGAAALALMAAVFVAVTAFRVWYFGQPFPNTFYAKVSSDTLQGLADGLKYAASFVLGAPFADLFVALWAGAAVWGLLGLQADRPGARGLLIGSAAVFGFLGVYAGLGGDHFALWRFYQPIWPLLAVAAAVGIALAAVRLSRRRPKSLPVALPAAAGVLATCTVGWLHYYQTRFDVVKEFTLVEQGLGFGSYLNGLESRPSIGVGPAGGIALAYDGHIYDLLGLNWTEMAHANPVKVGMRNHASFDKATFWAHRPDVFATFNRACSRGGTQTFWTTNDDAFDDIFEDAQFRAEYRPVRFGTPPPVEGIGRSMHCWPGFARSDWLSERSAGAAGPDGATDRPTGGIEVLTWSDLEFLN